MAVSYDKKVWKKIKKEWLSGQLSISDIANAYGPSRTAIRKKAKTEKWPPRGALVDEVRKEVKTRLLEDEVPAEVPPSEASDIVDTAAARGVEIVRNHRALLRRLLGVAGVTLTELETMSTVTKDNIKDLATDKAAAQNVVILSKVRRDGIKTVSAALARVIPLERQAYSLDDDRGSGVPIKYVAPDMEKPACSGLPEDDEDFDPAA